MGWIQIASVGCFFLLGEPITAGRGSSERRQCSSSSRPSCVSLNGFASPGPKKTPPTAWTCTFWTTGCGSPAYPRMAWLISRTLWLSWYFSGTEHGKDIVNELSFCTATLLSVLPEDFCPCMSNQTPRSLCTVSETFLLRLALPRPVALVMFRNSLSDSVQLAWVCIWFRTGCSWVSPFKRLLVGECLNSSAGVQVLLQTSHSLCKLSGSHVGISAISWLIPGYPLIVMHLFISLAAPHRDAQHLFQPRRIQRISFPSSSGVSSQSLTILHHNFIFFFFF